MEKSDIVCVDKEIIVVACDACPQCGGLMTAVLSERDFLSEDEEGLWPTDGYWAVLKCRYNYHPLRQVYISRTMFNDIVPNGVLYV